MISDDLRYIYIQLLKYGHKVDYCKWKHTKEGWVYKVYIIGRESKESHWIPADYELKPNKKIGGER